MRRVKLGQICEVVSGGTPKQMLKNIGMENLIGLRLLKLMIMTILYQIQKERLPSWQ